VSYTFDNIGRLTNVNYSNGAAITYVYDAAGNITKISSISQGEDGVCGSSDGQTFIAEPTDNLCSVGTANAVTLNNSVWKWDCSGTDGGSTTQCQANPAIPHTVDTNTGSDGNVSRQDNLNGTITYTITPDTDYEINYVSGCGGILSGNTYTTDIITADCTVKVDFIFKYTHTGFGHTCFKDDAGEVKCWGWGR
jgi:YD repeat-containing protein